VTAFRIIPRLDIKGANVVKGVHLEGLRVVGVARDLARQYAGWTGDADELLLMDAVASLYGRNSMLDIVQQIADETGVPVTVGGGLRSLADIKAAFDHGADKVAINTAAVADASLIAAAAHRWGAQAITVSIDAKKNGNRYEVYTESGREPTGKDAVEWAETVAGLGAGELLITSIDNEGTGRGFDLELVDAIVRRVNVPVIACGGCGSAADVLEVYGCADGVAVASVLHYGRTTVRDLKMALAGAQANVRVSA
jgi:cyclase